MFEGNFSDQYSDSIEVTEKGTTLGDEKAAYVKLSNFNVTDDAAKDYIDGLSYINDREVYWGFKGKYSHQLFSTQETGWIPVNNLSDISIRARNGQTIRINFSYLVR